MQGTIFYTGKTGLARYRTATLWKSMWHDLPISFCFSIHYVENWAASTRVCLGAGWFLFAFHTCSVVCTLVPAFLFLRVVFSKPRLILPFPPTVAERRRAASLACIAVPARSVARVAVGPQLRRGGKWQRELTQNKDGARMGLVRALSCLSSQ